MHPVKSNSEAHRELGLGSPIEGISQEPDGFSNAMRLISSEMAAMDSKCRRYWLPQNWEAGVATG